MRPDGFVVAMLSAVVLALLWPGLGARGGVLHVATLTQAGIALVFFAHGLMLAPQAVRTGMLKWRLHLFVQGCTFIIFPVLGALLYLSTARVLGEELRVGFFLLCAMSSTISSSVAMTVMAGGDVVAAVFNATISGLIGMVATPFLMQWVATQSSTSLPLGPAVQAILLALALPFALGQLLRPVLLQRLLPHKALIGRIDRGVIVLIVYGSFCESTASGVWARFTWGQLLLTALLALLLLAVMLQVTRMTARLLGFSRQEEIVAVFCGSKKSLASGAPMARILFGTHPGLGLIMLPLMLYHQIQLIVCTVLARRYAGAGRD